MRSQSRAQGRRRSIGLASAGRDVEGGRRCLGHGQLRQTEPRGDNPHRITQPAGLANPGIWVWSEPFPIYSEFPLHYGSDFCPVFRDWLIRQNQAGEVYSMEKVGDELASGDNALAALGMPGLMVPSRI